MFLSTYDSHSKLIKKMVTRSWHILQSDTKFGRLFRESPRFIYRKGKTIANYLVRSDLRKNNKKEGSHKRGTYACLSCQNCSAIIKGPIVNYPTKGTPIYVKYQYTCNTNNVIYTLKCPCGKCYIGQTSRTIKIRLNKHRSAIRVYQNKTEKERTEYQKMKSEHKYGETTVARHFIQAGHRVNELRWQILEKNYESSPTTGRD